MNENFINSETSTKAGRLVIHGLLDRGHIKRRCLENIKETCMEGNKIEYSSMIIKRAHARKLAIMKYLHTGG